MTITATVEGEEEVIVADFKEVLDTIRVDENGFKVGLTVDTPDFYTFVLPNSQSSITLFIREKEQITLDVFKNGRYVDYTVSGSPGSEKLQKVYQSTLKTYFLMDSLGEVVSKFQSDGLTVPQETRMFLDERYKNRIEKQREEILALINEQPDDITNIMAISQSAMREPLFPYETYRDDYIRIDESIQGKYTSKIVEEFHTHIESMEAQMEFQDQLRAAQKQTEVGQIAPNIAMPDPDGTMRELHDLKGKVVILDFWASWCVPCRKSNPELVATYQKYNSQGLEVFSVSLDGLKNQQNPKEAWLQAIKDDQLAWENHVSDMKGWNSSAVSLFGFNGIPHTILLDRNLTIVGKDLRGAQLEEKIEESLRQPL